MFDLLFLFVSLKKSLIFYPSLSLFRCSSLLDAPNRPRLRPDDVISVLRQVEQLPGRPVPSSFASPGCERYIEALLHSVAIAGSLATTTPQQR